VQYQGALDWFNVDHHGFAYVRSQLGDVNVLCRALLGVVDMQPGEVVTLAPVDTPWTRLYEFERGGLLPTNLDAAATAKPSTPTGAGYLVEIDSLRGAQEPWLGDELGKLHDGVCLIDAVNPTWSDVITRPYFQKMPYAFGVGEEVYHLVRRSDGMGALAGALSWGYALWHGVAAICEKAPLITGRLSTEAEMQKAAATVVALTCPAYDGEGFVAWRRT
jgi:hypothetical protein